MFTTGEGADELVANDVYIRLNSSKVFVERPQNLDDMISIYNKADVVISTRLHSAILALNCDVPVLAVNWDSKVAGFFSSVGLSDNLIDIDDCEDTVNKLEGVSLFDRDAYLNRFKPDVDTFFANINSNA